MEQKRGTPKPVFQNGLRGSAPRVVAKEDKFIYRFSERPLRKKCRGATRRRAMFRASGCPPQQRRNKKKERFMRPFLAPVEGLGPPTLRLTAECSTD